MTPLSSPVCVPSRDWNMSYSSVQDLKVLVGLSFEANNKGYFQTVVVVFTVCSAVCRVVGLQSQRDSTKVEQWIVDCLFIALRHFVAIKMQTGEPTRQFLPFDHSHHGLRPPSQCHLSECLKTGYHGAI